MISIITRDRLLTVTIFSPRPQTVQSSQKSYGKSIQDEIIYHCSDIFNGFEHSLHGKKSSQGKKKCKKSSIRVKHPREKRFSRNVGGSFTKYLLQPTKVQISILP